MEVVPASIASFLVSCAMLFALRPFAEVVGLVDKPGGRKTHHGEVPVVGGIAMFTGLLVAALGGAGDPAANVNLLVVAAFMVVLGALDDRFDLPPKVRLFAHLAAAVALVYSTGFLLTDLGDILGWRPITLGWAALPFTVLAIVALINAFNMLDGLDGLAGSVGLVALGGVIVIATLGGAGTVLLVAGSMFGAVAAFLVFNLPIHLNRPIRTFMGDAGSTLLGFLLAGMSLSLVQPQVVALNPIIVLWMMPIPIFELFSSTARRAIRGISPTDADMGHFHHRLIVAGFSVRAICALYFLVSAACCAFAVWAYHRGMSESLLFVGFCLVFAAWLLFVQSARYLVPLLPRWFQRGDPSASH